MRENVLVVFPTGVGEFCCGLGCKFSGSRGCQIRGARGVEYDRSPGEGNSGKARHRDVLLVSVPIFTFLSLSQGRKKSKKIQKDLQQNHSGSFRSLRYQTLYFSVSRRVRIWNLQQQIYCKFL